MLNSIADVWNNVLQQLKKDLSETTIATWFDELEAVEIQGNVFVLYCPNDFKKGYIESLFLKNINTVFTKEMLFEQVWKDRAVDDNTIMVNIRNIRAKIEPDPKNPRYLKTVWGMGYQFVLPPRGEDIGRV